MLIINTGFVWQCFVFHLYKGVRAGGGIVSSCSIWDDGCGAIKINRQCNFFFPILVCSFASNLSDLFTISWRIPLLVISMMLVSGCFMESIHCFRWICDDGYAAMECYFDYMVWTMLLQIFAAETTPTAVLIGTILFSSNLSEILAISGRMAVLVWSIMLAPGR